VPAPALSAEEPSLRDELAEGWHAGLEAGLRYWGTFGRLAVESVGALVPLVAELRPDSRPRVEIVDRPPAPPSPTTILVEAEAGRSGIGVFLVENTTSEPLSAPVSASVFHDLRGREVHPRVAFRPEVITLDPGDQQVVQVAAVVDEELEPDVRYHASISVPGLSATRIPIVLRRRQGGKPRPKPRPRRQAKAATTRS
jgi:hypothetical protein